METAMKKALIALALTTLAAAPAMAQEVSKLKIGMSFQEMNNPYFVSMKKALDEAAKSLGAKVIATDAAHNVAKQIADIEDMLQQNIDILLINPTDSAGVEAAVKAAKARNVIVVAVDANASGPVDMFVGSKNKDAGYQSCRALADAIVGKGEVAILDGIPVVPILQRVEGCKQALGEY
jgi:ribose transport system substrate-binding protein